MKSQIIFILSTLICCYSDAQIFFTERTISKPAYVVPADTVQGEFGISYNTQNSDGVTTHELFLPQSFLRFGINDYLEVRSLLSTRIPLTDRDFDEELYSKFYFQLGAKIKFWEQKGVLPYTSMIAQFVIPDHLFNKDERKHQLSNYVLFAFENEINNNFFINYNVGAWWDHYVTYLYALNLSRQFGQRFLIFAEAQIRDIKIVNPYYEDRSELYNFGLKAQINPSILIELSLLYSDSFLIKSTVYGFESDLYPFYSMNAGVTVQSPLKKNK